MVDRLRGFLDNSPLYMLLLVFLGLALVGCLCAALTLRMLYELGVTDFLN